MSLLPWIVGHGFHEDGLKVSAFTPCPFSLLDLSRIRTVLLCANIGKDLTTLACGYPLRSDWRGKEREGTGMDKLNYSHCLMIYFFSPP